MGGGGWEVYGGVVGGVEVVEGEWWGNQPGLSRYG